MTRSRAGGGATEAAPLEAAEFAAAMRGLGPFEAQPCIAVGVSGGADSLALTLLLHDWMRTRGGRVLALSVDHGLRPGSAREARWVGAQMAQRGIEHQTLRWRGPKPARSLPAAAREARHGLLAKACARRGILHLAFAHHRDDQAETLLLRLGRGSGLDGLAAMPPIAFAPNVRLLRPLLQVPKTRLTATLEARAVQWVDDPSNDDLAFARTRWRTLAPLMAAEGLTSARLAAAARHLGRARNGVQHGVAALLAGAAEVDPRGFLWLDRDAVMAAPEEVALRALARCLMTVGGAAFTPRLERLKGLYDRLCGPFERGATLGGCRLLPRRGRLLLVREAGRAASAALRPGREILWDGRFLVIAGRGPWRGEPWVGPLGQEGWKILCRDNPELRRHALPSAARAALPAIYDGSGLVSLPSLSYRRPDCGRAMAGKCRFAPKNALTTASFTVV